MDTPQNTSHLVINRLSGFNVLILLSMLYMSIMLLNAILTNRYIGTDYFYLLGGVFVSPFLFIMDDIIAEIYGYKITRSIILAGFACQTLFALICQIILLTPYPLFFHQEQAYSYILGPTFLRIDLSGFIAYIVANLINTYIITRWKVLLKGRKFWLRSLGSSTIAEAIYSLIAVLMIEFGSIPVKNLIKIVLVIYLVKALFSMIFAFPANFLVNYLKKITGIDIYDFPKKFTPFKYAYLNSYKSEIQDD